MTSPNWCGHISATAQPYPANALLAVQRELACNVFDSPDNCRGCDFYAPEMLLTYNEKGAMVPNHSVIKSIAKRYY